MTFLIWFVCILVLAAIQAAIRSSGVILGAIPTMLMFGLTLFIASSLSKSCLEKKNRGSGDNPAPGSEEKAETGEDREDE